MNGRRGGQGPESLETPRSLVSRFRIDGAGAVTQLVDDTWVARTPQQALVWLRARQRSQNHGPVLEAEELTAENALIVTRFRRLGSAVHVIGTRQFPSVLSTLLSAAVDGRWDDVRAEMAVGADPAARDTLGNTVLHYAALRGDVQLVRELVDQAVPIDVRNLAERSAEDIARERGHRDVASWLACRSMVPDPDEASLDLLARFGHLLIPLIVVAPLAVVAMALFFGVGGLAGWSAVIVLAVCIGAVVGVHLRAPRPVWSPEKVDPDGIVVRRWRHRRTIPFTEVTVLAINGLGGRSLTVPDVAVVGTRSTGIELDQLEHDGLAAVERSLVAAHADRYARIRASSSSKTLLAVLVAPLLERGIPVGPLAHRVIEHRGWSALRWAAAPLRRTSSWQLTPVVAPPRDLLPSPPDRMVVLPTGWVGAVADGFDRRRVFGWITVDEAVEAARVRAVSGRPLVVEADSTFPWVGGVVDQIRSTGVQIETGRIDVAFSPPTSDNALIDHIVEGRRDLAVDLVRSGWDLERADPWGRGPLAHAVATHDLALVEALLAADADPLAVDDGQRTPCSLARATWGADDRVTSVCEDAARSRYGRSV